MDEVRAEVLRQEIFDKVREYWRVVHAPEAGMPFQPGKSSIRYAGRVYDAEELVALTDSALEFWLTAGRFVRRFEQGLANFIGTNYALMVNSGSSANLLAFMTLTASELGERRVRRGDEVITVACGFPTTVAPIVQYGAVLVFVDVESEGANIEVDQLEEAYSPKCKAVMIAHTLGNPFNLSRVKRFCDRHALWLVEDNCDALGSEFMGAKTGSFGDISTSSFYPPHHMTTGEGGAVYMNDPQLHRIALSLRDWGRDCWCPPGKDNTCGCRFAKQFGELPIGYDHKYVYSHFGYNMKATDLQAAVGCAQLEKLPDFIRARRENYQYLLAGLKDLPELKIFRSLPEANPSWFGFLMTLTSLAHFTRNELASCLESGGIQTRNLFAGNLTRHPCFQSLVKGVDYRIVGTLENTDRFMNDALWIGLYPGMTREMLDYMIRTIREFCNAKGGA